MKLIWCAGRKLMALIVALSFTALQCGAATLHVSPVVQQTPDWCWLAVSEMVFTYFGIPPLVHTGIPPFQPSFQCQLIAAVVGPQSVCWRNCGACPVPAGSIETLRAVLANYPALIPANQQNNTQPITHLNADIVNRPLTEDEIKGQLLNAQPIVAAVDPVTHVLPRHVVLIVGYGIAKSGEMTLRVNDPYPYSAQPGTSPYSQFGGTDLSPNGLVHDISYDHFRDDIGWNETIDDIHP